MSRERSSALPRWLAGASWALTSVGGLASCGSSSTPPPVLSKTCNPSSVTISSAASQIVACDSGTAVTVAGGGASYIVVAQFAAANVTFAPSSYTIGVNAGGSAVARFPQAPIVGPAFLRTAGAAGIGGPTPLTTGRVQIEFESRLRALQRQMIAQRRAQHLPISAARVRPSFAVNCCPPAGSLRRFHVLASQTGGNKFKAVDATLSYVGSNILLYIDTLAPKPGFSSSQLQTFGNYFDQTLYPLDSIFGASSDIDNNGRVITLLSPVVNALTPTSQCSQGFIGGYFFGNDLVNTDTTSNLGEIFYGIVPDSAGSVSCPHSVAQVQALEPDVFVHELQHLINFSQHVVVNGGNQEESWVDEAESAIAEEQGSIYYEKKFPPPTGRSNPSQLFPDSSQNFINGLLQNFYGYIARPDTVSLTSDADVETGLKARGGGWLLFRWLGDQHGNAFYKQLEHDVEVGRANVEFAGGASFSTLFGDFGIALYADSLPGQPRTTVPSATRFITRNIRQLTNRLFTTDPTDFPRSFPLPITQLTASPLTASMMPGTAAYYRLDTSSQGTVTVMFSSTTPGVALPASLHPQLAIFRLPPGS